MQKPLAALLQEKSAFIFIIVMQKLLAALNACFYLHNREQKLLAALEKARFNLYNRDAEAVGRTAEGKARA